MAIPIMFISLRWCHNESDGVSNYQPRHCLLNRLVRRRSMKTSKLRVTGLCAGNSPVTGEFTAQMSSNVENLSIWWRHHDRLSYRCEVCDVCTLLLYSVIKLLIPPPVVRSSLVVQEQNVDFGDTILVWSQIRMSIVVVVNLAFLLRPGHLQAPPSVRRPIQCRMDVTLAHFGL